MSVSSPRIASQTDIEYTRWIWRPHELEHQLIGHSWTSWNHSIIFANSFCISRSGRVCIFPPTKRTWWRAPIMHMATATLRRELQKTRCCTHTTTWRYGLRSAPFPQAERHLPASRLANKFILAFEYLKKKLSARPKLVGILLSLITPATARSYLEQEAFQQGCLQLRCRQFVLRLSALG